MKITFLLPVASDALHYRRIKALERAGAQSRILAFERDYYPGKLQPGEYESLGRLQHRHYSRRYMPYLKAISKVRAAVREADVLFVFGLDLLLLGWLASRALGKRLKIVYEVDDVREVLMGNGLLSRSLRWLERFLLQSVDLLVTVTEPLLQGYFLGIQGLTDLRYQVIENKLDNDALAQIESLTKDGILRIGYFGLIRCRRSWEVLKKAAERGNGRVQVYVRGMSINLENLEEEARRLPYVEYGGPYLVPDDLPALYGQVNVVWVAYYHGESNVLWGHAHRFFEACYFKLPMFGQVGTPDGRIIEELGVGTSIDLLDVESTVDRILHISEAELDQWRENVTKLPQDVYVYTDEHERLIEAIQ